MLTVDYAKLGVQPGDRLLDLGCGFGRHAYQAARLGAEVVAFDAGPTRSATCATPSAPWWRPGSWPADHPGRRRAGRRPGAAVRRWHLRPGHRLRGPRAHPRRRGGHERAGPGPPAGRLHGGDRAPLWTRVRQLGPVRRVPRRARRPRADLPTADRSSVEARPDCSPPAAITPTGSTRPTGGCAAWSARATTTTRRWPPTTGRWCGTS